MRLIWMWVFAACAVVGASAERGGSLRGALEALQRRQRSRLRGQLPPPDYDALYEFVPPQAYPGNLLIPLIPHPSKSLASLVKAPDVMDLPYHTAILLKVVGDNLEGILSTVITIFST